MKFLIENFATQCGKIILNISKVNEYELRAKLRKDGVRIAQQLDAALASGFGLMYIENRELQSVVHKNPIHCLIKEGFSVAMLRQDKEGFYINYND